MSASLREARQAANANRVLSGIHAIRGYLQCVSDNYSNHFCMVIHCVMHPLTLPNSTHAGVKSTIRTYAN